MSREDDPRQLGMYLVGLGFVVSVVMGIIALVHARRERLVHPSITDALPWQLVLVLPLLFLGVGTWMHLSKPDG